MCGVVGWRLHQIATLESPSVLSWLCVIRLFVHSFTNQVPHLSSELDVPGPGTTVMSSWSTRWARPTVLQSDFLHTELLPWQPP